MKNGNDLSEMDNMMFDTLTRNINKTRARSNLEPYWKIALSHKKTLIKNATQGVKQDLS